jgi:transposase
MFPRADLRTLKIYKRRENLFMIHPKMQYTYVGIDSHKETHTAVFLDCFFEKLGELQFSNMPDEFGEFLNVAQIYRQHDTAFMFGMEDCTNFGKNLMLFLIKNGQQIKHVNGLLVARERKNQNIVQKTDSVDAECAARILISKFGSLPDAEPEFKYWALRSLVTRRRLLVRQSAGTKRYLHSLITQHYPNYQKFFGNIDCKTSLAFFKNYPSPETLRGVTLEELAAFLEIPSNKRIRAMDTAKLILDTVQDTAVQYQETRDIMVQSTIRQIDFNMNEIAELDKRISKFMCEFDCTLTTISGIDTTTAAHMLSCIGDIKKFPTPAKLARYAGIAPVTYASGKKDLQYANQRGNRELNSIFFWLAVRVSTVIGSNSKVLNSFFYDYYHRKMSEGKTKRQALKCVQRRLVNIVWRMLKYNEDYVNPPTYLLPDEGEENED